MKLKLALWISTMLLLPLIVHDYSFRWDRIGLILFMFDIFAGVIIYIALMVDVERKYAVRFGKRMGTIISITTLFTSLLFGLIFVIGGLYLASKLPTKNIITNSEPNTKSKLFTNTLKIGSYGEDVSLLQTLLFQDNTIYTGPASGYFGGLTQTGLQKFQAKYNLSQTGGLDTPTINKLTEIYGDRDRKFWLGLINNSPDNQSNSTQYNPSVPGKWGESTRVAGTEHGWVMKVGSDPNMGSAQETFDALNIYRSKKGVRGLNWDGNLGSYAQQRATELATNGGVDDHKGFKDYIGNADNRRRLGFYGLGENASCGYRLTGTHLIEWLFAGDAPHENNQLNSSWSDVGIGVSDTCIAIIFAYDRI